MKKVTILLSVIFLLSACSVFNPEIKITDFESCVAAGNPVMESYPRQCRADGQTFVEIINDNLNNTNQVACTQEAKLCPDGTAVGRTGPNCEFAPCPGGNNQGIVSGHILLGPTCPVMQNPPDPACADKPYQTTIQVIKVGSPSSAPFTTATSNAQGYYEVSLPPGEYALQPVGGAVLPRCETKEVTVVANGTLILNLACDTGIR